MGKRENYVLRDTVGVNFLADTLAEALEDIVAWLKTPFDITVLAIAITYEGEYVSVTLLYE